jgi:CBS domain-containing protein
MLAHELVRDFPAMPPETRTADVLAAMIRGNLPGIVVLGADGRAEATLSLPDVLDLLLPWPLRERPTLARVFPDEIADRILTEAISRPIGELMRTRLRDQCCVRGQATSLEVVTAMARQRSALAMVLDTAAGPEVISAYNVLGRLI